jgi:hypothetical protein
MSRWHHHVLNGMISLLLPHLDLARAFLAYRSKPHATGAQLSITCLYAGISQFIAERFHAFIPP